MGAIDDLVSTLKGAVSNISQLITAVQNTFPRINGSFTLTATATTVVTQTSISASSIVLWAPTNAAAGTLEGSAKALFLSARTPGASFTVATASGGNAAGTEQYSYVVVNPS